MVAVMFALMANGGHLFLVQARKIQFKLVCRQQYWSTKLVAVKNSPAFVLFYFVYKQCSSFYESCGR
jgi:hypothetical protein